jgi:C-terminal processing protease CtpA/Prc
MSYLTPGKLEVGYSLTRKRRERGYRREELTRFRTHSVSQGNSHMVSGSIVVLLVNQHTASAGEMVSAFAEEKIWEPSWEGRLRDVC